MFKRVSNGLVVVNAGLVKEMPEGIHRPEKTKRMSGCIRRRSTTKTGYSSRAFDI